ncbi:hypothetical protein AB833_22875 [Chromatiales bacterium (ex Bugula neritina AB1)]|nr:hypothetical protein AB833_22875 [Chromatiales bacterium (ex Bugula neritina AB1)]
MSRTKDTLSLRCTKIINETADVKTFRFANKSNEPFCFKAGQYVTLKLEIEGQAYQRCYTIASSPENNEYIDLTVKLVDDGIVSNWLLEHFKTGDYLEAVQPAGTFYLRETQKKALLMISAGSGVTPMLSMLRTISDDDRYNIKYHHSARTSSDLISHHELEAISRQHSGADLTISYNFSRECVKEIAGAKVFGGRVTKQMLMNVCADLTERDVFVCGPPEFMRLVKESMLGLGLPENQYFEESFEISAIEADADYTPQEFDLVFSHSNIKIKVASNQTVLEAAEEVGIYLDYSCSSGICGSCTSYLVDGEIHSPEAKALDDSDVENGEFLPCCSFARSDLVVDL